MKKLYITIVFLLGFYFSQAQIVDIPDVNFKFILINLPCVDTDGDGNYDSDVDTNDDGEIQVTEAEEVLRLIVGGLNVNSLEGIQSFISLLDLHLSGSIGLDNIDLSQNSLLEKFHCVGLPFANLDLSQNVNLIELHCGQTSIINLDLSQNQHLEIFDCGYSPLTTINLGQNSSLTILSCYNTLITEIDISQCPNIEDLFLRDNPFLTSIDLTQAPNLIEFNCNRNQISNLDLSHNPNLEELFCSGNQLISLELSGNPNMFRINCENNLLTSLNIKNGNSNAIARLIAFENPNLTCIQVDDAVYANNQICNETNDGNWCKDDWAEYNEDCILGIEENNLQEFAIYPNPTQNILNIETQEQIIETIKIINLQGVIVKEVGITDKIDISSLASGMYFIQIFSEGNRITKKFIKN